MSNKKFQKPFFKKSFSTCHTRVNDKMLFYWKDEIIPVIFYGKVNGGYVFKKETEEPTPDCFHLTYWGIKNLITYR